MKVLCFAAILFTLPLMAIPMMHGPGFHQKGMPVAGPKVRVMLKTGAHSALLEVKGPYRVIKRSTGAVLSSGSIGKRYVVHGIENGLRWGEEFPQTAFFTIVPTSGKTFCYVDGFQYKGAITVALERSGLVTIINETLVEDFVKSVLAVKYQEPLSREAAAALAIVERTRVFARVMSNEEKDLMWDISAFDCGYCGYGVTQNRSGIDAAVDWTPFMVVRARDGFESLTDMRLSADKACELSELGCDARRILSECFPQVQLGLTADPERFAVR